jgi:hypothetical protein
MELTHAINIEVSDDIITDDTFTCTICMDIYDNKNKCLTNCNHEYCKKCIHAWFDKKKDSCPTCRSKITYYMNQSEKNHIVKINESQPVNNINTLTVESERLIQSFKIKIYKLNFLIFLNIGYMFYNLISEATSRVDYLYYKEEYENCTSELNQLNENMHELLPVYIYSENYQKLNECEIPKYYLDSCNILS